MMTTNDVTDPTSIVEPSDALPPVELAGLSAPLQEACSRAGWTSLMPVQSRTIPYLLAGRDLMIQSRTGSGKTGAFILPMLERLDLQRAACQALVLVPTRELAQQVSEQGVALGTAVGMRTVAVYGGVGYGPQIAAFEAGAHLVVGTPGRILDHLIKGTLSLDRLTMLIFDEADRMLSMGFYPDMKRVQGFLPPRPITGYMFSATFPPHVLRLAGQFLREPDMLSLSSDHVHVAETEHVYYVVPAMDKDRSLVRVIEIENPPNAIIFCNMKGTVHYVAEVLKRFGYDADELSADLSQAARERVLGRLRKGNLRFLVATDVAARGIDIPEITHVIQYEPPEDSEAYVHRSGRTGRAGASGEAITLVAHIEQLELQKIAKRFKIDMQKRELPSDEDVAAAVSERAIAFLEARMRSRDNLEVERMRRFVTLARNLGKDEESANLMAMLLDDYYQEMMHRPPETPPRESPIQDEDRKPRTRPRKPPSGRPRRRSRGGKR